MAGYMIMVIVAVAAGMVLEYFTLTKWLPAIRKAVLSWWRKKVSAVVLQGLKALPEDARNEVFRQSVNPSADEIATRTIRSLEPVAESVNPFAD